MQMKNRLPSARTDVDDDGRPVLEMQVGKDLVQVGVSAGNILNGGAPPQLVRQLLEARLHAELRHKSAPGISEVEVARDWKLLQKTMAGGDSPFTARTTQRAENLRGNRP